MDGIHYTFLILILTIALFIWDKLRADFVALASMTALVLGGVLTAAFLTPISSTTNLMVLTPGGYRFNDYVKVGFPLMVLFLVVSLVIVPLVWQV